MFGGRNLIAGQCRGGAGVNVSTAGADYAGAAT
jgi:hypothetical protein